MECRDWQSILVNTSTKTLAAAKDAITTQLNFKEVSIYVRDNGGTCAIIVSYARKRFAKIILSNHGLILSLKKDTIEEMRFLLVLTWEFHGNLYIFNVAGIWAIFRRLTFLTYRIFLNQNV